MICLLSTCQMSCDVHLLAVNPSTLIKYGIFHLDPQDQRPVFMYGYVSSATWRLWLQSAQIMQKLEEIGQCL